MILFHKILLQKLIQLLKDKITRISKFLFSIHMKENMSSLREYDHMGEAINLVKKISIILVLKNLIYKK